MFKKYFKIAWRNLLRNKLYSTINISGLAIGLAVCMLIVLYVGHESSYDSFHTNANKIVWVQSKIKIGNDSLYMPYMSYATGPLIKQSKPSVESFLRIKPGDRNTIIQNGETPELKFAEEKFLFADSNFFQLLLL
jgi:putative ABC transport system permease protein